MKELRAPHRGDPEAGSLNLRPPQWLGLVGVVLVAIVVAGIGSAELPLDGHEAFVVRTTQEMHERSDWVVPYFNGAPRLTKPPLSYWLTGMSAWATGSLSAIQPWHGRLPSVVAGIGLVLLTLWLGSTLLDRTSTLLAGLILGSSAGFFAYTHDARPDLLYAFWCTLGYTAFAVALHAADRSGRQAGAAYLMWASYGLATLTKGPQLPAMLLGSCLLFCVLHGLAWRRCLRCLRPLTGLGLMALLTVPWWLAVHYRLGGEGLRGTQLAGTLLRVSLWKIVDPYYLYRTPQLVVPWVLLLVPALLLLGPRHRSAGSTLLWIVCLVPALILNLGPQQRWFYTLPILPALCLLLAAGVTRFADGHWRRWFLPLHWLLLQGVVVGLLFTGDEPLAARRAVIATALWVAGVFAAALLARRRLRPALLVDAATVALMTVGIFLGLSGSSSLWSPERFERARLAQSVRAAAIPKLPIVSLGVDPSVYVYYAGRSISVLDSQRALQARLRAAGREGLLAILRSDHLESLPSRIHIRVLDHMEGDADEAVSVARLWVNPRT